MDSAYNVTISCSYVLQRRFSQGIIFFIALGLVLEFTFWFGALSKKKIHTDHSHDQTDKES